MSADTAATAELTSPEVGPSSARIAVMNTESMSTLSMTYPENASAGVSMPALLNSASSVLILCLVNIRRPTLSNIVSFPIQTTYTRYFGLELSINPRNRNWIIAIIRKIGMSSAEFSPKTPPPTTERRAAASTTPIEGTIIPKSM